MTETKKLEKATFAAGCFWGVEESFRQLKGVIATQAGYTGGKLKDPSYKDVCTDTTGHVEAVEVTFNPKEITDVCEMYDIEKKNWEIINLNKKNKWIPCDLAM